jgi:hypothetical protein
MFADAITKLLGAEFPKKLFKPLSAIYVDDQIILVDKWLAGLSITE